MVVALSYSSRWEITKAVKDIAWEIVQNNNLHALAMEDIEKIDEQTHMGIDFASIAKADVPASQSGKVAWVGYLGIHGNMVLIDHGLGLMTQYSHLSDILVRSGDSVQAGQIIGHTGTTGLAGGDHLHFGVLIFGIPVEPLEWLDEKWVKNNITNRLNTPL